MWWIRNMINQLVTELRESKYWFQLLKRSIVSPWKERDVALTWKLPPGMLLAVWLLSCEEIFRDATQGTPDVPITTARKENGWNRIYENQTKWLVMNRSEHNMRTFTHPHSSLLIRYESVHHIFSVPLTEYARLKKKCTDIFLWLKTFVSKNSKKKRQRKPCNPKGSFLTSLKDTNRTERYKIAYENTFLYSTRFFTQPGCSYFFGYLSLISS